MEFEDRSISVYMVFLELLSALKLALENQDALRIRQIFAFAEWCFRQKNKELWNAAGVAFYEHLDDEVCLKTMHLYLKPDIYRDVRTLLEARITASQLKQLDESFNRFKLKP